MKINYSFYRILGIFTIAGLFATACISDQESPIPTELSFEENLSIQAGENLRKGDFFRYKEKFSNQIFPSPNQALNLLFFPGTGTGNATYMGKSISFINQVVTGETTTEGAAVTLEFGEELEKLGVVGLNDDVHSVTLDKKGNAIFFKSKTNQATHFNDELTIFEADIEVVGGMGIFENASGSGKVKGSYNPTNGKGESTIEADVKFK